jgi:benzoyl-CoA reductase/2-hydroxyglutaryl-CoA dehydratase subunit BcrC/BadD/HgdB
LSEISSTCTVFAESEVISQMARGTRREDVAEQEGYDVDICSYAKLSLGYIKSQVSDIPLPLPDFVCCCNNIRRPSVPEFVIWLSRAVILWIRPNIVNWRRS